MFDKDTLDKYGKINKSTMLIWALFIVAFVLLFICLVISFIGDKSAIDADDFGFAKVTVYASGQNVTGVEENQLAEWEYSGYHYNGDNAVIMVYNNTGDHSSIWSSWFCDNEGKICDAARNFDQCQVLNSQYCANPKAQFESIVNPPCLFSKGVGFYMLLTDPTNTNITDPNQFQEINRNPNAANFFTTQLWYQINMYHAGQEAQGYNQAISPSYNGGAAYFKILDSYYQDNSGFYKAALKRGFTSDTPPPIASVISKVQSTLDNVSKTLFDRIIKNPVYKTSLKAVLFLYMIINGILYLGGIIKMNQKELINMTMKLIIVIQLLTTDKSWDVFNNYFFQFFTTGLNEIIGIVTFNISGGEGIYFFDNVLNLLFSYETSIKILTLIYSIPSGIIATILIFFAFALFSIAIAKAVVLYMLSYIAISLLITVAPIFITFLLFKTTRYLFENWINQFNTYFFQPVLVFASLSLLGQTIINIMYRILGFKSCYVPWISLKSFVLVRMWQICNFNKTTSLQANIAVPGYGYWDANNPDKFYTPYQFVANRYIDLPFLDPNVADDASLISAFEAPYVLLNAPILYNSLILVILTFLIYKVNDLIPNIARGLAGVTAFDSHTGATHNTGSVNALSSAANSAVDNIGSGIIKKAGPMLWEGVTSLGSEYDRNRFLTRMRLKDPSTFTPDPEREALYEQYEQNKKVADQTAQNWGRKIKLATKVLSPISLKSHHASYDPEQEHMEQHDYNQFQKKVNKKIVNAAGKVITKTAKTIKNMVKKDRS
jgi:type IV secretion system protein VirB6